MYYTTYYAHYLVTISLTCPFKSLMVLSYDRSSSDSDSASLELFNIGDITGDITGGVVGTTNFCGGGDLKIILGGGVEGGRGEVMSGEVTGETT